MSLFARLGGESAIQAAVEALYGRLLADERVAPFFEGIGMPAQIAKLKAFLSFATGGADGYTGRDLRTAHAHLHGLGDEHVDIVVHSLGEVLIELGAAPDDIQEVAALAESVRDDVLGR